MYKACYLDRLDSIVQESRTEAMERERVKLSSDLQKLDKNMHDILDQKLWLVSTWSTMIMLHTNKKSLKKTKKS